MDLNNKYFLHVLTMAHAAAEAMNNGNIPISQLATGK